MRIATLALLFVSAAAQGQTMSLASPTPVNGGSFGWSVAPVPDVDGDGRPDIVVGAMHENPPTGPGRGRVHLFSGTGVLLRTINPPTAQPIGTFGWAVCGTPDLTGDGKGDLLVGAPWEVDTLGNITGRAYLFNGATGALVRAWLSPSRINGGGFGWSVGVVPDVNGDGKPDLLVGSPGEKSPGGASSAGRMHILSGATGGLIRSLLSPNPEAFGNFGFAVAGLGDINGDGSGDIAVGAPYEDPGTTPGNSGRVYVYSGATGGLIRAAGSPYPQTDAYFGMSLAVLNDVNGDGRNDLAVGVAGHRTVGVGGTGLICVYSGVTGQGLKYLRSPVAQNMFGVATAAVPDMDGDGCDELVGGGDSDGSVTARGIVSSGRTGVVLRQLAPPAPAVGGSFGSAVAGIADLNGDGKGEPIVSGIGQIGNTGRVHIFK